MTNSDSKSKKQKISIEEVKHVAKLAKLDLTTQEIEIYTQQLGEVVDYNVALLNEVDVEGIEPLYLVNEDTNRVREDEAAPSLSQDEVLRNGASIYNGFFKVKAVIEE